MKNKRTVLDLFDHIGEVKLFNHIINHMNKTDNEWSIDKAKREYLSRELDISPPTVNRYLTDMVERHILIRKSRGNYQVNKDYIGFKQ